MTTSEALFFQKLKSSFDHVLTYENVALQREAVAIMPLDKLKEAAENKFMSLHQSEKVSGGFGKVMLPLDSRDLLVMEMIEWFRTDFFRWVNAPACDHCGATDKTTGVGASPPTAEEAKWQGHRVEVYKCSGCQRLTRFPRYNHPKKLLYTRRGRCGEWANCFTLLLRAAGFEARYVLDWTDHVWSEYYSESQHRWVHADTGEGGFDKPLLYEAGWGKKLTYIIAFSKDDIMDVTWRYTANVPAILLQRKACSEVWLVSAIDALRKNRQEGLSVDDKLKLQTRQLIDIIEGISPKVINDGEMCGRQTGSLAWRLARKEMGVAGDTTHAAVHHVFSPTELEKEEGMYRIRYSCSANKYYRGQSFSSVIDGWEKGSYECDGIQRKVEIDWNMVYLARQEDSKQSTISWKFTSPESHVIDSVTVRVGGAEVENAQVQLTACSTNSCWQLRLGDTMTYVSEVRGSDFLTLTAVLSGGVGECAWQHSQLFRESRDDTTTTTTHPLDVTVTLMRRLEFYQLASTKLE